MYKSRYKIKFILNDKYEAEGELIRFLSPRTIESLLRILPIEGRIAKWKEEVYFEIPLKLGGEKLKSNVETGTIAYWPMGSAICIFYGKSQPYSPVSVLGKITKNLEVFKSIKEGAKIKMEEA
jgi:hypothetical protein